MSSREVTNWLQSHRLGAYVDVFAEHEVTWDDLGELGDEDLRKMGLETQERQRLLRAVSFDYLVGGGERKQLTVLYYDIVESIALSNLFGDPEAFLEFVRSIHTEFEVRLSRLGGTKYQLEGDGAYYLFGWPAIEGNPAARAAHAAFAIMEAATELKRPDGRPLQFRVTIASDLTVIMPTKDEGEVQAAGNAMHLAGRLKPVCPSGKIVIDRATRDRFGRAFHVVPLGPQSFAGIEGKVEAFVLKGPTREPHSRPEMLSARGHSSGDMPKWRICASSGCSRARGAARLASSSAMPALGNRDWHWLSVISQRSGVALS